MLNQNYKRIITIFNKWDELLLGIIFIGIFTIMITAVIMRYVVNDPLIWSDELSRYILVWATLTGSIVAAKKNDHIKIDINIFNILPKPMQQFIFIILNLFIIAFLVVFFFEGIKITYAVYDVPLLSIPISRSYFYAPLPLAAIFMIFYVIREILIIFKSIIKKSIL